MGYRGKVDQQNRAKELRAMSWTLLDIANELGVAKSSVSLWVREVDFIPDQRRKARKRGPNKLQVAKAAEIERCRVDGIAKIGTLTEREFLMAGLALYAGDGGKTESSVRFANTSDTIVRFYCRWLRTFFEIDESRLRIQLYLHEGLDLDGAINSWSEVTGVPGSQFTKPYRAVADPSIRKSKHVFGCAHITYSCVYTHRQLMGMMNALLSSEADLPG